MTDAVAVPINLFENERELMVVTPMRTKFAAAGRSTRPSACVWTSMKPGATVSPEASISCAACDLGMRPIAAIRPSLIATSASDPGRPVPSTTTPPATTTSYRGGWRTWVSAPPASAARMRTAARTLGRIMLPWRVAASS